MLGNLTPTESWLQQTYAAGQPADFTTLPPGQDLRVDAAVIAALCSGGSSSRIDIRGAHITGQLNLEDHELACGLYLTQCRFDKPISLRRAVCRTICLDDSLVPGIDADWANIKGSLVLRNRFFCRGELKLLGASIDEILDCRGAHISNAGGNAILAGSLRVTSVLLYGGFYARGTLAFPAATIASNFNADGATIHAAGGIALNLERLETGGHVFVRVDAQDRRPWLDGTVRLYRASIGGNVEFNGARVARPGDTAIEATGLTAKGGVFLRYGFESKGQILLDSAHIGSRLDMSGARLHNAGAVALSAVGLSTVQDIRFAPAPAHKGGTRSEVEGTIVLERATVGSDLNMTEAWLTNPGGTVIRARGATIRGDLFLRDARASGEVQLLGVRIDGRLHLAGAVLDNERGMALYAAGIKTGGSIFLGNVDEPARRFVAHGSVVLDQAEINGHLRCEGATLNGPEVALSLYRGWVHGDLTCTQGFSAMGLVQLMAAKVDGNFVANEASFENRGDTALNAERLIVGGYVHLKRMAAVGALRFFRASMLALECDGARIAHHGDIALEAYGLNVIGDVYLRNSFAVDGGVNLTSATVNSRLDLSDSIIRNHGGLALRGDRLQVQGDFLLHNSVVQGAVHLFGAASANLECIESRFEDAGSRCFFAPRLNIRGALIFRQSFWAGRVNLWATTVSGAFELFESDAKELNVQQVDVGTLDDDLTSWPAGTSRLDGFTYRSFSGRASRSAAERLKWLGRQPPNEFRPGVYEHLVGVFRRAGHADDARTIAIRKREASLDQSWKRIWKLPLRLVFGHGYLPWRALGWAAGLVLAGAIVFGSAARAGSIGPAPGITAAAEQAYPFQPLVYSIDTLLPVIDLQQEKYWAAKPLTPMGSWIRVYLWVHMALGWILITLLVSAWTGIIKRD
jgi:hypothetical protein